MKGEWFGISTDGFLIEGKMDEGYAPIGDRRWIGATWIFALIPIDVVRRDGWLAVEWSSGSDTN